MPILKRATEQQQSEWRPVPEGTWRWEIGKPEPVPPSGTIKNYRVKFPLVLTDSERERLREEYGEPEGDVQQSWRSSYTTGLSLGFFKDGAYQTTKLIDFVAAAYGAKNSKAFRSWIMSGGGPPQSDDPEEEIAAIIEWLGWLEGLEIYGSVRHEADKKDASRMFSRFGGPIAVGSLPGEKDDGYQATGKGKLRSMLLENGYTPPEPAAKAEPMPQAAAIPTARPKRPTLEQHEAAVAVAEPPKRTYDEIFGDDDEVPFQ